MRRSILTVGGDDPPLTAKAVAIDVPAGLSVVVSEPASGAYA